MPSSIGSDSFEHRSFGVIQLTEGNLCHNLPRNPVGQIHRPARGSLALLADPARGTAADPRPTVARAPQPKSRRTTGWRSARANSMPVITL